MDNGIYFETPRGNSPQELEAWARETCEKLNRLQLNATENERGLVDGIRKGQGNAAGGK